jgi:hypothetical protein
MSKLELLDSVWWKASVLNFSNMYKEGYGIYRTGHLWIFVSLALVRTNTSEIGACLTIISESLERKFVQWYKHRS